MDKEINYEINNKKYKIIIGASELSIVFEEKIENITERRELIFDLSNMTFLYRKSKYNYFGKRIDTTIYCNSKNCVFDNEIPINEIYDDIVIMLSDLKSSKEIKEVIDFNILIRYVLNGLFKEIIRIKNLPKDNIDYENLMENERFNILFLNRVSDDIYDYLTCKLANLEIYFASNYHKSMPDLLAQKKLEGLCWQTTKVLSFS